MAVHAKKQAETGQKIAKQADEIPTVYAQDSR